MSAGMHRVEIDTKAFEWACRAAALDGIDVARYFEIMVMCDVERIRTREFLERSPRPTTSDAAPDDGRLAA
jgi:hypothetical protein